MDMITLLCWVYHDHVQSIFSVEISTMGTIGVLKDIIKDRRHPRFCDVEADKLLLFSIFIPDTDDEERLQDLLKQLSLEDKSHLDSQTEVSELSPEYDEREDVQLIVVDEPSSGPSATELPVAITPDITLNCWVHSTVPIGKSTSLLVEISSTKTVAALKGVIKNKKPVRFRDVDPSGLILYKVSLPCGEDDSLEDVVGARTMSSLGQPLRDWNELSAIFVPLPADDQIHLIVVPDDLTLSFSCWIRGAEPVNSFGVQISMNASVNGLKNVIKATYGGHLADLTPDRPKLYKISVNEEAELASILVL